MKSTHSSRLVIALSLTVLVVVGLFWLLPTGAELGPEQELRAAWNAASAADSFDFETNLEQTTYPAPSLANVGRSSRTDSLRVSGAMDRPAREMRMTLAKDALAGPGQALEMRVRDGAAEGRVSGGAWQQVDDASNAFAPGGDMLSYIDAAVNVTRTAEGFAFDIDSAKLSEQMREQLARQMTARGELPPGMSVEAPAALRGAVGSAQVWLNEAGYPARMSTEMSMPVQANGERSVVRFSSRFENYKGGPVTALFGTTLRGRLQELRRQAGSPEGIAAAGTLALTAALGIAFAAAVDAARRSRRVRTVMIGTVIATMTGGPLLQTQLVYAANEQVRTRTAQKTSAEKSRVEAEALKASLTANTWAPNLDPLAEPVTAPAAVPAAGQRRDLVAPVDVLPYTAGRAEADETVVDNTDADGDGLTGTQEARLGINPSNNDSDGDGLLDRTEVTGFTYAGKTWYLDPASLDTNGDGKSDGAECLPRLTSATGVCPDTDGDGVPDAFDDDNDNDGVPDSVDSAAQRVMGANGMIGALAPFSATAPLQLSVNNLQRNPATGKGYPTFVEFQVRPDNPAHLTQESNVFDWPSGDELGQIQRSVTDTANGLTNTTFATYAPNGDARDGNGDLRLTPMLSIRMSGDKLPLPFIAPSVEQKFEGNGISGTLRIAPTGAGGASSLISFTFTAAGSYSAVLAAGKCLKSEVLQTQSVSSSASFSTTRRVTALANGAHVLILSKATDATQTLCVPLLDIPNGTRNDAMVDMSFFTPYGVMLRDVNPTTMEAYVPVVPIIDERTNDRVAFGARMPYMPDDPTAWGNYHQVRLIWMLTLLEDGGGSSIVQVYNDAWTLAGLSVREDRGTDVAIAFEDPASDADRENNDRLHALANGLGSTFLTARDADGDTARDVTVPTIKSRFDKGTNGSTTLAQRWNLPADAFKVSTYSYANSDEQIRISMTETKSLLEANFYAAGNALSSAPLLLFARESRMRNMSLDSAAAATGAQVTMNMDPVEAPQRTFVNVNWAPYQRVGGQWQIYPVDQYASKLTSDFQERFKNEPEDERVVDALLMQTTYLSILSGMNSVLQEEGGRYVADADAASDGALSEATADLTDAARLITNYINPQAAQMYAMLVGSAAVTSAAAEAKSKLAEVLTEVQTYSKLAMPSLKLIYGIFLNSRTKAIVFNPKYAKNLLVGAMVGLVVMAAAGGFDGDAGSRVQSLLHVSAVVSEAVNLTKAVKLGAEVPKAGALLKAIIGAEHALTVAKNMPEIMLVVQIALTWGMAMYQLAVSPFSTALLFSVVANAVAQTIVVFVMYAIGLIPGIGPIIAAVLGLIDAVVAAICSAVDAGRESGGTAFSQTTAGKRVCAGISGLVAAVIQTFLYSRRALIGNMYSDDRLQFLNAGDMFTLVDPGAGIVQGANATVKLDLKNTIQRNTMFKSNEEMDAQIIPFPVDPLAIPYLWQYNDTNLKTSVFQYALQPVQSDFHDGLDRGSMSGEWTFEPGGKTSRYYVLRTVQTTSRDLLAQAGVNRQIQLGLAEAQVLPVQQCFLLVFPPLPFPMIPICSIESDKSTNFIPLGEMLTYDVLPPTLDDFLATVPSSEGADGYTLAWARGSALELPRQKDIDGDGLRNRADGGNDPNDSVMDVDGDGLSDFAELQKGTDPVSSDPDQDGLNDRAEIFAGTNPRLADTDGDGLNDKQEIDGWEFVYEITAAGQQKSWVTSDPLSIDGDEDNITDALEKIYGFHPRVKSELKVLTYASQVNELAAPQLLWRMDGAAGVQAFADESGHSAAGVCPSAAACPETGVVGRYGNAARFDGGDAIEASEPISLANASFSVAFWAKRAAPGADHFAFVTTPTWGNPLRIGFRSSNTFTCDFGGGNATETAAYADTDWHHWACTYDAATRQRTIFRDGVQAATSNAAASTSGRNTWSVGGNSFNGTLDEFAVFDRALNATEVQKLRDGIYNTEDKIVAPNDALRYESTVGNELLNRYANGLLTTQMPGSLTSNIAPQTFVLQPQETKTLRGVLTVTANAASGVVDLTQAAEASIQDRREQSGYAEAWLKFDDAVGSTRFADYSGVNPSRTATCYGAACPTAGATGAAGSAVVFDGVDDELRLAPGVIVGDYTVAAWVRPDIVDTSSPRSLISGAFKLRFSGGNRITALISDGQQWLTTNADMALNYSAGTWYHVAYVVTTNGWTGYVNGVARGSGSFVGRPVLADTQNILYISEGNGAQWKGALDDLRIYARALAAPDVAELSSQTVLNLSFDSGTNARPTDASSVRNTVTCGAQACPASGGGVVGAGVEPGDDQGYLIASNPALNFNDGNVTLMTWVYPRNTGDASVDAYPQGLIGNNSGDANSAPSLQRVGRKLRFGFGASDGWKEATTSADVLAVNNWNHVAAAFDGTTVNFFVNGVLVGSSMTLSGKRPNASDYSLLVGRSDNNWFVNFTSAYVNDEADGVGRAEVTLRLNSRDGSYRTHCYSTGWNGGGTYGFCGWGGHLWTPGQGIDLWEEDCSSEWSNDGCDETLIRRSFYGADLNNSYSQYACNNTCLTLYWTVSGQNAIPFKGALDEMSAYKRALGADQVLAMYEASRLGQVVRLNEPPGSTEYRDATGTYKLTCADPNCPTAGVAGRLAQGLQFAAGQTLSAPWQGGGEANTVGVWFKTNTGGRTLFTLGGDRQVSLDASGNLVGAYDPGMPSLQKLKDATQSSPYGAYAASNAIDGNFDTFNHTNIGPQQWWQASLDAGAQRISRVRVYNRFDGSWQRLNPFIVILYGGGSEVWRSGNVAAAVSGNPNPIVVPVPNIVADRVRIQLVNSDYLHVAEVEVETDPLTLSNASQSSTATGYPASNAIDGNLWTFGNTNATTENWWQADIDGASPIVSAIRLYNRRDANQFKLSPFNVVLYDASGIEVWRKDLVTHDKGNNALVIPVPNIVAKRIRIEHKAVQYLHFGEIRLDTRVSAPRSIATSGVNYADGQWHHVMYTMGDAAVGQRLFVDGVQKAAGMLPYESAASKNRGGNIVLGGADASGFDGYMDQVRLFSRGEGLATAQKLVADASVIVLKLDEPANSASFANVAGGANAACTACPTMGGPGKIGSAANFSGTSSIATANAVVPNAFSFGLWANAREWSAGARLFEKTGTALKLYVENGLMKFSLPTGNQLTVVTMTLPVVNQWHHIVVNYDGAAVQMYLNGSLAKSMNVSGSLKDTTLTTPFAIGGGYKGLIDEFTMYQRALTPPEIRGDYQYQLGLIAERSTERIVVDATPPQAIIDLADNLYVPNVDRIVSVQAIDTGSAVPFLSFTSQRSGEGAAVQGRSLQCIDASGSGAWCPTFAPRGEGRYTLSAIGRDGVGNASSPASKTMFVDATPPQLVVNALPTLTRPAIRPDGSREVIFSGTVSDPALTNAGGVVAGSGVQTSSVLVELIGPDGDVVGGAGQRALVTGIRWMASFVIGAGQSGNFSIQASAADRVGNAARATRSAVRIDVVDPVLSFDANMPGVVSQTTVFSGVASEIPNDGGAAVYMPFEEPTNAVGYVGRARTFASNSTVPVPYAGTITGTFSVAAWIKPNSASGAMNYFASRRSNGYSFALGVRDGNTVYGEISDAGIPSGRSQGAVVEPTATPTGNGSGWLTRNASAPFAYTAGKWMHVAYVVTPNSYTIYVNGEIKGSGVLSGGTPLLVDAAHQMQLGGTGWDYSPFNGMIDEVAVYRSALSGDEVRRLAQPAVVGIPGVEVAFKPVALASSGEPVAAGPGLVAYFPLDDIVGADQATGFRSLVGQAVGSCSGTQCPTSGARGMRDAAATFDGANDKLVLTGIDSVADRFTTAAWVRPDSVRKDTPIMSESVDRATAHPFRVKLSGGNQIIVSVGGIVGFSEVWLVQSATVPFTYTAGQWVHVAAVVSTTGYVLYANGVSVGSGAFSGSPLFADSENISALGRGALGAFDDVRIYSRTLRADEIYGLYAGSDPVLTLDFTKGVGDASAWEQPVSRVGAVQLPEGQGIAVLNGVTDSLTIAPNFALANRSWSVGAWAKRGSIGTADVIFGQGQATSNNGLSIGFNADNRFTCSFTNNALTTAAQYTDLDWHYWQCTFDASSRIRTLYRDGVQVATDVATAAYGGAGEWRIGGTPWSASDAYAGSLDDVQVYPYAFDAREANAAAQSGFRAATVTAVGTGNAYGAWRATPPAGLEGIYRAELRGVSGSQIAGDARSSETWTGMVDTAAPRISVTRSSEIVWLPGSVQGAVYTIQVQDMRLYMSKGLRLWPSNPGSTATCANGELQLVGSKQAWVPWAGRLGGAADTVEATYRCTLPATTAGSLASSVMMTMCDFADNCSTSSTFSSTVAARPEGAAARVNVAEPRIEIYYPTPKTVYSDTIERHILGYVEAPGGIDFVTIMLNGHEIYTHDYNPPDAKAQRTKSTVITDLLDVEIDWSKTYEGENVLIARVFSGGSIIPYTTTFLLDYTWPSASFDALPDPTYVTDRVLTQSMYTDPFILFTGVASDASDDPSMKQSGIADVKVQIDDAVYVASVADDRWSLKVPRTDALPVDGSGPVHTVKITVTDHAGWNRSQSYGVLFDMVAAVITPTWTGANRVSFERPLQEDVMDNYHVGMTRSPAWTFDELTRYGDPTATRAAEQPTIRFTPNNFGGSDYPQSEDGFTSYGHVVIVDSVGNVNSYMSPISYTDRAEAPDYVSMLETDGPYQGKPYRGWMESGCSLLGTDTRVADRAPAGAALKAVQKLYATSSSDRSVRITWSGADWKRDGDLFVYLDTVPDEMPGASYVRHGSNVAYDPYSATMSSTLMLLPVSEWFGVESNYPDAARFNADWMLWVEDNDTVHLLRWSDANQRWEEQELPDGSFNFDDSGDVPLTEFLLSHELLDTEVDTELSIVAFASEDGALRTWSVLPAANPATSGRVVAGAPAPSEPLQTMMSDAYYLLLSDANCSQPEARMLLDMTAEPGGVVLASKDDDMRLIVPRLSVEPNAFAHIFDGYYDLVGNYQSEIGAAHRSWLSGTYCPAKPYDLACLPADQGVSVVQRLSRARDVEFPALLIGQRVTYTVRYVNEAAYQVARQVFLLSEGASGLGTVQWDALEWAYGCPNWVELTLPPQSAGELTFTGIVIRPTSRVMVDFSHKQFVQPGCGTTPSLIVDPYYQLAAYYDEDQAAPSYVSIDAPLSRISPGLSLFYGEVVDKSPVPTVTLEYVVGAGATNSVVCGGDTEPSDGVWACVIDVGAAADGTDVKVRVKATDAFDNDGAYSAWAEYKVDAAEPVLTPQSQTQTSGGSGSGLTIGGVVSDDGGISGIQVCNRTTGVCTNITIVFTAINVQPTKFVIEAADVAPEPLGRGMEATSGPTAASICGVGSTGVVRSFVVSDTFKVADVTVNLNVEHAKRSDLLVKLVSPKGTTASLIAFTTTVRAANFDVVLTDAAAVGVTEDGAAQDVGAPSYENERRPVEALSVFDGEEAVGEWLLAVCDMQVDADGGVLNSAQLQLQAEVTTTSTTGTWTFDVAAEGDVDGEDRTFEFYAVDASGNRSSVPTVVTVTLDNVAPVLTATQVALLLDMRETTPTMVLTGTVSDGGGVQSVQVRVEGPSGAATFESVRVAAGSAPLGAARTTTEWEYELVPSEVGRHKVRLTAADAKGNTTTSAEYEVYAEESVTGLGLSVDASEGLVDELRQFVAATTGGSNVEYTWDFGDGEIITGSGGMVEHAYSAAGAYNVVVTASNALGSLSAGVTMNVNELLVEPTPTATPAGPTPTPPGFEPTPTPSATPSGPTPTPGVLRAGAYLPLLMRDAALGVDLVVTSLQVEPVTGLAVRAPAEIVLVVKNESRVPVGEFWVDLYVDPTRAPRVNEQWSTLCEPAWPNANCYGGAWHVTRELAPGETMTLTSQSLIGDAAYSHWTGTFVQAGERRIYVLVDSYSATGNTLGAVREEDEMNNGANMTVTVSAGMMVQIEGTPESVPEGAPVEELGPLQER